MPLPDDALWSAFTRDNEPLFNYFLEQGADVNQVDTETHSSILYSFTRDKQLPMVKTLLQKGLSPNLTNKYGLTAFVSLLKINRLSTAKVLLEYTDTNILPPGQTNLMEAALWAKRKYYKNNNPDDEQLPDLEPEVIQFISNLSKGK